MSGLQNNVVSVQSNSNEDYVTRAHRDIPYSLISAELGSDNGVKRELNAIASLYDIYRKGADFTTEGTGGDYVPSNHKYKKAANLINKEARFLFGNMPDVVISPMSDTTEDSEQLLDNITNMQNMLDKVFEENSFECSLIKAAKDCFIGKRVACLVNFNEQSGVTIQFLRSTQFVYEMSEDNSNELSMFTAFITTKYSMSNTNKRIYKKKYELDISEVGERKVYLTEEIYDGASKLIEKRYDRVEIDGLERIPVVLILNDGLSGDNSGISEIEELMSGESLYSKLSNGDVDAARKCMNPIRYTVDMDPRSTKGLSSAPGSYWDLSTNQNADNAKPSVGQLTSSLEYSNALDTTLKRINADMHDTIEMPDISLESMTGVITSGKALKSIYWPLIVRCNEKMKTWGPALKAIAKIILDGSILFPDCVTRYTDVEIIDLPYEVHIENNYPLPEDEQEEKNSDITEVDSNLMSRKAYMKKWRGLTDEEAEAEIEQIAKETEMLNNSAGFNDFDSVEDEETQEDIEQDVSEEEQQDADDADDMTGDK